MDETYKGGSDEATKRSVLDVALAHHLVSRYTSLVAVDITPTRPVDMPGSELGQPIHLARAQDLAALPKTAVGWQLQILLGVTALMLAAWLRGLQRDAA